MTLLVAWPAYLVCLIAEVALVPLEVLLVAQESTPVLLEVSSMALALLMVSTGTLLFRSAPLSLARHPATKRPLKSDR